MLKSSRQSVLSSISATTGLVSPYAIFEPRIVLAPRTCFSYFETGTMVAIPQREALLYTFRLDLSRGSWPLNLRSTAQSPVKLFDHLLEFAFSASLRHTELSE